MSRRSMLRGASVLVTGSAMAAMGALTGCAAGRSTVPGWWELEDLGEPGRARPDRRRAQLVLGVEGLAAGALMDGVALVYSRTPGMRAVYQYASWTERPAVRIARLAQRRLRARGGFKDVVTVDAGVPPDLLLSLMLEQLYHDVPTGELRIELGASLLQWHGRRRLGLQTFEARAPAPTEDAAGAAAAAGQALTRVLGELCPWAEQQALSLR